MRNYLRVERRLFSWLIKQGIPSSFATFMKWALHTGLLLGTFFLASGAVVFVALALIALRSVEREVWAPEKPIFGDYEDHRKGPFYDPINYNDMEDPRFDE